MDREGGGVWAQGLVGVPTTVAWHFEFNEIYAIFLICQMHCGICSSPAASATRQSAMHQAGGFVPRKRGNEGRQGVVRCLDIDTTDSLGVPARKKMNDS